MSSAFQIFGAIEDCSIVDNINIAPQRPVKCFHNLVKKFYLLKWVTPLDFLPRRLGLFLWALLSVAAENVSNDFGFIRFEKGEIFWKKTKGTAEGTSKDLDNSVIKLSCANRLVILYPFVYIVLR